MNVAETIKERRAALAISQLDLAEIAGVSIVTVKDIERSKGTSGKDFIGNIGVETVN